MKFSLNQSLNTCEQKKEPLIPYLIQVGHLNFAEFLQPGVSHICSTITSAISNLHEHKQNLKEINQNKQQEIQSQFKNKYSVKVFWFFFTYFHKFALRLRISQR